MSKELEAFDRVWEDCSKLDLDYVSKHNLMDDLREIKKALTPPTADEVCKALSKLTRMSVYYNNGRFRFHGDKFGEIVDLNDLPPHLVALIGRFYEGLEKVGNE